MSLYNKLVYWLLYICLYPFSLFTALIGLRSKWMDPPISANTAKRLEGQVAIVAGGASGIGASTARIFSENGASVVIADTRDGLGKAVAEELGSGASFQYCDASVEDEARKLVDATVAEHGRVDIMYIDDARAGVVGSILDSTADDVSRAVGAALRGAFYGAKHAARAMRPRRRGCILFTASTCASTGHVMSKYAVIGLVKNLSAELGKHGIRVNCISAASGPHDGGVARAALYLASGDANYVTGHNLAVDGGVFPPCSILPPFQNTWVFSFRHAF